MANKNNLLPLNLSIVNDSFEFKLYLDCVVYYAFIVSLVLAASVCHANSAFRNIAHTRIPGLEFKAVVIDLQFDIWTCPNSLNKC